MKFKTGATIFLVLCLIVLSIFAYNEYVSGSVQSITQVYKVGQTIGAFSFSTTAGVTLQASNGDAYYEERCIDVKTYLSQGYVFLRNDSKGCPIVGSEIVLASQNIGRTSHCKSGVRTNRNFCAEAMGTAWANVGCAYNCGKRCGWGDTICSLKGYEEKGGSERVQNTCDYKANQLLAGETFNAGTTITKTSTRYPIAGFCRAHPAVITDGALKQSTTSTNVQQDLLDGKSVTVGAGQTLTLFYIIDNNANLPTICDSTKSLALDVNSNTTVCKSTLGFTYLCSAGVFDALSGTCVVQPTSATICEKGRYDVEQDKCVYNPPIQYDCGSDSAVYEVDRNVCVEYVKEAISCNQDYTLYKPNQAECESSALGGVWQTCPQCPADKVCPTSICEARCSVGVTCIAPTSAISACYANNGTISTKGTCKITVEGITSSYSVCGNGEKFNALKKQCEAPTTVDKICLDGSTPTRNEITQALECVVNVEKFKDCPTSQVYNQEQDRCVDKIQVYDSARDDTVLYSETRNGCSTSLQCSSGQVCNTDLNICQVPVGQNRDYVKLFIYVVVIIVVAGIIKYMYKKKRGKKN